MSNVSGILTVLSEVSRYLVSAMSVVSLQV